MSRTDREEGRGREGTPVGAAVLLVGHGSQLSPDSSRPVHHLARRLREAGAFRETRVAFWKEEPFLPHALDLMEHRDVLVVPVFTSEGYFTERVVPRELGIGVEDPRFPLRGQPTAVGGRTVRMCAPLGTHPGMARIVLERAREVASLPDDRERAATVVVIGHGTELHPGSADTTHTVAERLDADGSFGRVLAAFLDQEPRVQDVLDGIAASDVILVPFFIAEGYHTDATIPEALGLTGRRTVRGETTLWYARPVGTHPSMSDVVRDLVAYEVGSSEGENDPVGVAGPGTEARPDPVDGIAELEILRAKGEFVDRLGREAAEPVEVLQAVVRPLGVGRFEIRHVADLTSEPSDLRELRDPEEAVPLAARTKAGEPRPLRTTPDLAAGWRFVGLDAVGVWEVLGHLYPAVLLHRHLERTGKLSVTGYREFAARQTGIHAGVGALKPHGVSALLRQCCGPERCLRAPTWARESGRAEGRRAGEGAPCPSPCPIFLSRAKEALSEATGLDDPRGAR